MCVNRGSKSPDHEGMCGRNHVASRMECKNNTLKMRVVDTYVRHSTRAMRGRDKAESDAICDAKLNGNSEC